MRISLGDARADGRPRSAEEAAAKVARTVHGMVGCVQWATGKTVSPPNLDGVYGNVAATHMVSETSTNIARIEGV